jgi:hypothetical protein
VNEQDCPERTHNPLVAGSSPAGPTVKVQLRGHIRFVAPAQLHRPSHSVSYTYRPTGIEPPTEDRSAPGIEAWCEMRSRLVPSIQDELDGGSGSNSNDGGLGEDYCVNPDREAGALNCESP